VDESSDRAVSSLTALAHGGMAVPEALPTMADIASATAQEVEGLKEHSSRA
jgi:hypothetical protein